MKVAIKIGGVNTIPGTGKYEALVVLPDPDLEQEEQKIFVEVGSMIVVDVKEWKEQETA